MKRKMLSIFGARLRETEDVVDEEEDVLRTVGAAAVAEGFSEGQAAQCHGATGSRRLVHLAEDHRHLRLLQFFRIHLGEVPVAFFHGFGEFLSVFDDVGFDHLAQQVVTLAGTLAHAGEDGESVVFLGDVVDQLFDQHGFAYARAAEKADLAALEVGLQQVDDLDTGVEHLLGGGQVFEFRRFTMDREGAFARELSETVDGLPGDIHHAAADLGADGHRDRGTEAHGLQAAFQAVSGVHGDAADGVFAYVLLDFNNKLAAVRANNAQGIVDTREVLLLLLTFEVEVHVHHRTDNLRNMSLDRRHLGLICIRTAKLAKIHEYYEIPVHAQTA